MTVRECCELMVKQGRIVKTENYIRMFKEDGSELFTPYRNKTNGRNYFRCSIDGRKRHLPVYNLVWLAHGNKLEDGKSLDHIDRNRTNDSIENLRLVTQAEQSLNREDSKTDPFIRVQMRSLVKKRQATIRGMARYMNLCRETVQDIIHMRYKLDQQLEGMGK